MRNSSNASRRRASSRASHEFGLNASTCRSKASASFLLRSKTIMLGAGGGGCETSAGESVANPFKLSFYQLIPCFIVSEFQWCAISEACIRLVQPDVGLHFVAKYRLGLMFDQLNVLHYGLSPGSPVYVSAGDGGGCCCLGAIFAKRLNASLDDQYWLNHVAVSDQ